MLLSLGSPLMPLQTPFPLPRDLSMPPAAVLPQHHGHTRTLETNNSSLLALESSEACNDVPVLVAKKLRAAHRAEGV